ncbi:MAG TPA: peptidylprolyl isomerase [Thermodesulfovibrionales bacterium]|nr:peptidylprolyl isomerase [Thermodesulfovibrionales bacterium]
MKKLYLILISFCLVCIFFRASHAAVLLDRVVAVVNSEVINWSELYKMMEFESTDQMKALKEEDRLKVFKNNEPLFLEKLIDMRLQIQEAKRIGLDVSPDDVKEAIDNIKQKYSLSDKAFQENLSKEGFDFESYKKTLSDQILINQFLNKQVKSKIVVSGEEINNQVEAYRTASLNDEAFKMRQIFLRKPKEAPEKKAVEEKAALIMQRVQSGEDFSKLAQELSEDQSAKQGGDLGFVKKSLLAREFIDTLSRMKPGDVSQPFWTERGLHIIKLEEKTAPQGMDEIREAVKRQLTDQKFAEKYKSLIKDLREKAHIEIRL